jgi:YVTN family beta-propeller protein
VKLRTSTLLFVCHIAAAGHAEAQTKAYVVSAGANLVTVIDTATGSVAGTVPVGANPSRVAISGDGARAYVSNTGSVSVSVIDTTTDTVTATIAVGDSPSALAIAPDGATLYVMTASGDIDVVDTAQQTITATIPIGSSGDIGVTPDGSRLFVAAGRVYVIDTASNTVLKSFAAEEAAVPDVSHSAASLAVSPDGTRVYVGVVTFNFSNSGFSAGGNVVLVDIASESVSGTISLFSSLPGSMAVTPDGSRVYVGIQSTWVNTGYGAGFFNGRVIYAIDSTANTIEAVIDLGADGANFTQQNTAGGIAVTPDRGNVYAVVPRLSSVAAADVTTNAVSSLIPVTAGPFAIAIVPDAGVASRPYAIDAADDSAMVTTAGGTAVANVLANDRLGGFGARTTNVMLSQLSSSSAAVSLDASGGAVDVAPGVDLGVHTLLYRICELASASNCDDATVTVAVRAPFVIDAVNDSVATLPTGLVTINVLANDTLDGTPATTSRVTVTTVATTSPGIMLDAWNGSLWVPVGTPPGRQTLTYRICEIASPANCDSAEVSITVNAFPIDAVNDAGAAPRSGGTALASVLANDTFNGGTATPARVRLSLVSSTNAGIVLNPATGAVTVAGGTPVGTYSLRYSLCETATPSNCDEAEVSVTIQPLQILAVSDSARGSSKTANTALASVLTNDWLGNARATTANVRLSQVSLTPANAMIRLDPADGSVDILGKTSSGTYSLVYAICEVTMPANCARGTVKIDLSGK